MEETWSLFFIFCFSDRNVNGWCRCESLSLFIGAADRAHQGFCLETHCLPWRGDIPKPEKDSAPRGKPLLILISTTITIIIMDLLVP